MAAECVEPVLGPAPAGERLNQYGELLRDWRNEAGLSQEALAAKLQVAGWDIDPSLVTLIELGHRPISDVELGFFLDVFGKKID